MAKLFFWKYLEIGPRHCLKQIFSGVLFLFICCDSHGQLVINARFRETPLQEALKQLEQQNGLKISFNPELIKNIKVTAQIDKAHPAQAFETLLQNTGLKAEILQEGYIVIVPAPPVIKIPDIHLSGIITDSESNEKLPFATVYSKKNRISALTDETGKFVLVVPGASIDADSLTIQYLGYAIKTAPALWFNGNKCPTIGLTASSRQLVEIVITDHAVDPVGMPVGQHNNYGRRAERGGFVPGLGEPDPMRMIQLLPGVTAEGDKAGELLIRGGGSDQNLVLWEGIPIYHTGHLFGVVSALNPYVVKDVNVWKGNFSADMGGRASSIVEMSTDFRKTDKITAAVGVNLLNVYASLEIPFARNRGGLMVAGRIANSDLIKNAFYQRLFGYATQNSRIRSDQDTRASDTSLLRAIRIQPTSGFNDFNAKFLLNFNSKTRWEISAFSGTDVLRYRVDANIKDWNFYYAGGDTVNVTNVGFSSKLKRQWTSDYQTEWSWAWSAFISDYQFAASFDSLVYPQQQQRQNNFISESVFKFDNQWRLNSQQALRFGFQSVKTNNEFSDINTNFVEPQKNYEWRHDVPSNQSAFYGIWQIGDPGKQWHFETGFRRVIFNYATRTYWEPRISGSFSPVKYLQFKFNAGVFRQFMRQAYIWNELGLNNEAWFTADDKSELPVLTNRQINIGAGFHKNGWVFDVEFYTKWLNPVTGVNLRFNGQPQNVWAIRGDELAYGMETLFRKRWGIYTQMLSYTYGQSLVRYDSLNAGITFPGDYDQRHNINWMHHFGWKHWVVSSVYNFRSGRPYTPPTGISILENPNGTVSRTVAYGRWNSGRLPDYKRVDISIQYIWKKRSDNAIGISLFNFFNQANIQNREFFVETTFTKDGQPQYGISSIERSLLGRTVNIFLLIKW